MGVSSRSQCDCMQVRFFIISSFYQKFTLFIHCSPPFSKVREWIPLLLGFNLPIILLVPDCTRLKAWFADHLQEFQYLIPPSNLVKFMKSDNITSTDGGRDKCSFFCHGFKEVIPKDNMAIEVDAEGNSTLAPIDDDMVEPMMEKTEKKQPQKRVKPEDAMEDEEDNNTSSEAYCTNTSSEATGSRDYSYSEGGSC